MQITLRRPDDWHLHLRDGDMLRTVAPESRDFARAVVMPNLVPPVVTAAQAEAYRGRVRRAGGPAPLMTLYLTEDTDPADVVRGRDAEVVFAVKLYPAGATTNSASGVRDFDRVRPVLAAMEEHGIPLLIHGEVTDLEVDVFDREAAFLERRLEPIRRAHPALRITLEHVTTAEGVDYVRAHGLGATITVQHLMMDRNDMLVGGLRPHLYCLPVLKRRHHREALVAAATGGEPGFFLGTDSAPHPRHAKEAACCAAGCFTAPVALPCLAHVFEDAGALDRLEGFASLNGPARYGLPSNEERITLRKGDPWEPPREVGAGGTRVTVFDPGRPLEWRVAP
jgi:dihydroorotase